MDINFNSINTRVSTSLVAGQIYVPRSSADAYQLLLNIKMPCYRFCYSSTCVRSIFAEIQYFTIVSIALIITTALYRNASCYHYRFAAQSIAVGNLRINFYVTGNYASCKRAEAAL